MSNLYDEITQIDLNTLIYRMMDFIYFEVPLNLLNNLENKYCKIKFDLDEPALTSKYNNIVSGNEIIIENSCNINLSELTFSSFKYYVQFDYYKLDADIDNSNENIILHKEFKLTAGNNIIAFDDAPIYLLTDFKLVIRK